MFFQFILKEIGPLCDEFNKRDVLTKIIHRKKVFEAGGSQISERIPGEIGHHLIGITEDPEQGMSIACLANDHHSWEVLKKMPDFVFVDSAIVYIDNEVFVIGGKANMLLRNTVRKLRIIIKGVIHKLR